MNCLEDLRMMELWNEICYLVKQHRKPTSTERDFQIEAEHLFEKLGWSRFKGEIVTQQVIPIGAAQSLKPDIIIVQGQKSIIVAELKKPNAEIVHRNADQLISYMLQLRLRFGLLIGDTLQVYYDIPEDNERPVKVIEIPFISDNAAGAELVRLLSKDVFSIEQFASWCIRKVADQAKVDDIKKLTNLLSSQKGQLLVSDLLRSYLLDSYSADVVSDVMSLINITVQVKKQSSISVPQISNHVTVESSRQMESSEGTLEIKLIPASPDQFKILLLQKKHATITVYYADGRVDKRSWDANKLTESSNIMGNLRSRPDFRNGEWQKLGIVKVICEI